MLRENTVEIFQKWLYCVGGGQWEIFNRNEGKLGIGGLVL